MDVPATVTSKGQVTLPKVVREALDCGATRSFSVQGGRGILAKVPDFLDLAGPSRSHPGNAGSGRRDLAREDRGLDLPGVGPGAGGEDKDLNCDIVGAMFRRDKGEEPMKHHIEE